MVKKLFILRGVPGCGKSELAEWIKSTVSLEPDGEGNFRNNMVHLEADMYFMKDGEYKFDGKKLHEAHKWCKDWFVNAIEKGKDIVLSNTSTQLWEFEEYKKIAEEMDYMVFCLIVENRHGGKNTHGVPEDKIQKMADRFQVQLK